MPALRSLRNLYHDLRHGWLAVTVFYVVITLLSYAAYHYLSRLPAAHGVTAAADLWRGQGSLWAGLQQVWFIFAWGFGIQFVLQLGQVFRRKPRQANFGRLLRHGTWVSAHAGLFEELVFRLYAFLSFIILLRLADIALGGAIQTFAAKILLPVANIVTLGLFDSQFSASNDWTFGTAIIIGSLFFRSAHLHYGKFSKANVWVIGLVMFWLVFNYGLGAAIIAHFVYDFCVYAAIAITSPLQPRPQLVRS